VPTDLKLESGRAHGQAGCAKPAEDRGVAASLDLGRDPNRHLAFGFGAHFCLGNQLARLEGRIALRSLLQRFEHIELAVPRFELRYKPSQSLRGLLRLPLRLR
jgi:cytochrome P450 PksS